LPTAGWDGKPLTVTDATFDQEVLGSPVPVLVDCWAPWCGPCRALAPIIDQIAGEYAGRLKVAKLNTDENPRIGGQYRIMSIPTLLVFRNGEAVDQIVGAVPKGQIEARLQSIL
jgi:thioredoxin 2